MFESGFTFRASRAIEQSLPFTRYGLLPGDEPIYVTSNAQTRPATGYSGTDDQTISDAYTIALYGSLRNDSPRKEVKDATGRVVGFTTEAAGCVGRAENSVIGDQQAYAQFAGDLLLIQTLLNESTAEFWSGEDTLHALGPWQNCLRDKGVAAPKSLDGLDTLDWRADQVDDQRRTAEADISCKAGTNVMRDVFRLDWTMQVQFIESNQTLVQSLESWREKLGLA